MSTSAGATTAGAMTVMNTMNLMMERVLYGGTHTSRFIKTIAASSANTVSSVAPLRRALGMCICQRLPCVLHCAAIAQLALCRNSSTSVMLCVRVLAHVVP
jgi:hypothetical protein